MMLSWYLDSGWIPAAKLSGGYRTTGGPGSLRFWRCSR